MWWLQRSHKGRKLFHDRIWTVYFSSISQCLDSVEENCNSNKLSEWFKKKKCIQYIFFLAWCRKFILCPIPLETARYDNLKMKKVHPFYLSPFIYSPSFGDGCWFLPHVSWGRGFSLGRLESALPHSCLGFFPPLQICIDWLALNQ